MYARRLAVQDHQLFMMFITFTMLPPGTVMNCTDIFTFFLWHPMGKERLRLVLLISMSRELRGRVSERQGHRKS